MFYEIGQYQEYVINIYVSVQKFVHRLSIKNVYLSKLITLLFNIVHRIKFVEIYKVFAILGDM